MLYKYKVDDICVFTNRGTSGVTSNDGKQCRVTRLKPKEECRRGEPEYVITFLDGSNLFGCRERELELLVSPQLSLMEKIDMGIGRIIAFPEEGLQSERLAGLRTTRLCISGHMYLGVQTKDLKKTCTALGVRLDGRPKKSTEYEGVYLAQVSQDGGANNKGESKMSKKDALKRTYMELCGYDRKATLVESLKQVTTGLQLSIEKCQENLVALLREMEETQQQLQVAEGVDEASLARFGDEYEGLLKHPDIEKLEIVEKKILVYTKKVVIRHDAVNYNIGKFTIEIDTLGKSGAVRMMNQTRKIDGYSHPHINEEGIPCLGNIKEVIPHMIAGHKYAAVVSVCIQYLKSYEHSGDYRPFKSISNWPVDTK